MRALIIGASGQVGGHLVASLTNSGHEVHKTHYSHPAGNSKPLDIMDKSAVQNFVAGIRPTHIFLPAAAANVDACEKNPQETYAINVLGVANVVEAANQIRARLIYYSSDYIFDGRKGLYKENEPPNPICEYGRQKVYAEHHIAAFCADYLILRTTVVYGWESQQKNFVIRLIDTLKNKKSIQVPMDQVGTPTYAPNLARASIRLAETSEQGIFHITGPEPVSRFEFARETARVFDLPAELIVPVSTQALGQAATRPLNLGLDVTKASNLLDFPLLGYKEGLQKMAQDIHV